MCAAMAAELDDDEGGGKPPISTDGEPEPESRIQFEYDAYAEVERWWSAGGRERIEALAGGWRLWRQRRSCRDDGQGPILKEKRPPHPSSPLRPSVLPPSPLVILRHRDAVSGKKLLIPKLPWSMPICTIS